MVTLRMFLSAASLGKPPPPEHLAERRKVTRRAWGMVPEKLRPAARAALGTVLAVRSLHQPQVLGLARGDGGTLILVWGTMVKPSSIKEDDDGHLSGKALNMEDLHSLVKAVVMADDESRGAVFAKLGAFHMDGAMRSPEPMSEPVEDLLCSALSSLSVMEMSEEMTQEQIGHIERRLDSGPEGSD